MCDLLNVAQLKLSFHLRVLKGSKLVRSRHVGHWMYYSFGLPQFVVLKQYLTEFR